VQTILEDPWYSVAIDPAHRLIRVKRSATHFDQIEQAEQSLETIGKLLEKHDTRGYSLLIDLRDVVGRNDASFEKMMARSRQRVFGSFERSALLMKSVVGKLQAERMAREHGGPTIEIYLDEAEAFRAFGISVAG
jgi:hypothetical protein